MRCTSKIKPNKDNNLPSTVLVGALIESNLRTSKIEKERLPAIS